MVTADGSVPRDIHLSQVTLSRPEFAVDEVQNTLSLHTDSGGADE